MYDPELLRTFLAVSETLSFTQAADRLGIRQSTASQHVRRLEDAVGRQLFVRDTRTVSLTADGEAMSGFAKDILAAQQRAVSHFSGAVITGRLRFGVTDDLALTPLPRILRDFRAIHPQVNLDLTVLQNGGLLRRMETGHLDVAFVKRRGGTAFPARGQLVRRDRLVWAMVRDGSIGRQQPVPLVLYQAPSLSRDLGLQALERAGRASRITCTVKGVNGVLAAVRAGLGIAVMTRSLMPTDLVEVPAEAGMPALPQVDLVLVTSKRAPREAASALNSAILANLTPLLSPMPDRGNG